MTDFERLVLDERFIQLVASLAAESVFSTLSLQKFAPVGESFPDPHQPFKQASTHGRISLDDVPCAHELRRRGIGVAGSGQQVAGAAANLGGAVLQVRRE